MAGLEQLRYVRLKPDDLVQAADFAVRVLGLEPIDRTQEVATFRSDHRDYTLAFGQGHDAVQAVGFEVRYSSDLDTVQEALNRLGVSAGRGSADDCALRKVKPLAVTGVGGKYFYNDDREVEDHVFCTYEFPGPKYWAQDQFGKVNDPNDRVVVTYSSISTNASVTDAASAGATRILARGPTVRSGELNPKRKCDM